MIRLFFISILLALCNTTFAREIVIQSEFFYNNLHAADVTETLRLSKKQYSINSTAKAVGLAKLLYGDIVRQSEGIIDAKHGLMTTLYFENKKGKEQRAEYDIQSKQLRLKKQDNTKEITVEGQLYDYLTSIYQSHIMQKPSAGTLAITNGWRYKSYDFLIGKEETIETGLGAIKAIPITRESERGKRTVWVAPSQQFLVVRSYINDKGHVFETIVNSIVITEN